MDNLALLLEKGYEIKERLGAGGMGTVYRAYQIAIKRDVAIKVLPEELALNPDFFGRFNREAETLTHLEHPHIVPVYDYGTSGNLSYIVMRLLTGGTLNERLLSGQPLSLMATRQILQQITSALDYAHQKGIVHRDIKASNVMLDEQGNAYLTDFGIAKLLDATGFTATGMMLGTPAYMAPEQWKGADSTPQTDIYALGVLLYAMLTGRMPFEAPTPYALMSKHLNETPAPVSETQPRLPNQINRVLDKALAKTPQDRYERATQLSQAFNSAIEPVIGILPDMRTHALEEVPSTINKQPENADAPTTVFTGKPPLYRRPAILIPAVLLLLALAGAGLMMLSGNDDGNSDDDSQAALVTKNTPETATAEFLAANPSTTVTMEPAATGMPSITPTNEPPTNTSVPASATPVPPTATELPPSDTSIPPTLTTTPSLTATETAMPTLTKTNSPSPTVLVGLAGAIPVSANSQWSPIIREINGVEMVLVPAGSYMMGASTAQLDYVMTLCPANFSADTCRNLISDEAQQLQVRFDEPFWIDRTEAVTGDGSLPHANVTWAQAQAVCSQRDGRLPTEAEWEYAAGGPDALIFPWGNVWDNQVRANICDSTCKASWRKADYTDGYETTSPAGSWTSGASWVGALDMGGNVWEYTSTIYRNYPYNPDDGREDATNATTRRVLRGGGYTWLAMETTTTARATHVDAGAAQAYYGFRCMRDYQDGDLERYVN